MSLSRLLVSFGLLAGLLFVTPPATADQAADAFTALPLSDVTDQAIDVGHGRAYVSGPEGVAMVHLDGSGSTLIPGLESADRLALTPDGATLYVSLPDKKSIAAVDTSTLGVVEYPVTETPCGLATSGGYVWFFTNPQACGGWDHFHRLDPATGAVTAPLGTQTTHAPLIESVPESDSFVTVETWTDRSNVRVFNVGSSGELTAGATLPYDGFLVDEQIDNAGSSFTVYEGNGFGTSRAVELTLPDLQQQGTVTAPSDWNQHGFRRGPDSFIGWAGNRVRFFDRNADQVLATVALGPETSTSVEHLDLVGTTLYVSADAVDGERFYALNDALRPVRLLTAQSPDVVQLEDAIQVSGRLADEGGSPISGALVTLTDEAGAARAQVSTDADGNWQFSETPKTVGSFTYVAHVAAEQDTPAVVAETTTVIPNPTPDLVFTAPDVVDPGETFTLSGDLSYRGTPATDTWVGIFRRCTGDFSWVSVGDRLTDADGAYSITDTAGPCLSYDYQAYVWGNDRYSQTEAVRSVKVAWVVPTMDASVTGSGIAGEPVLVHASLDSPNGPLAGKTIKIHSLVSGAVGSASTDEQGAVAVEDTPTEHGIHCYSVEFGGDSTTKSVWAHACIDLVQIGSSLALSGPAESTEGQLVTLTGQVKLADTDQPGPLTLKVARHNPAEGTVQLADVTTADDGSFTLSDTPTTGGLNGYTVTYAGSVRYAGSAQSWTVDGAVRSPKVSVATDRSVYRAGDTAQIIVRQDTGEPQTVEVSAFRPDGTGRDIYWGVVPPEGLTLPFAVRVTTTFKVELPQTGWSKAAYAHVVRFVRLALTTTQPKGYATDGLFRLYHSWTAPRFRTNVFPSRSTMCLRFEAQRRIDGSWQGVRKSGCLAPTRGQVVWDFTSNSARHGAYRARPVFAGDADNAATNGAWSYLKFD